MHTRVLFQTVAFLLPFFAFSQKAVSAGFGSYQTLDKNKGAYFRVGIDIFQNLEATYTYRGAFGQRVTCMGDAGTKVATQFTLGHQLGLVQYTPHRRFFAGFSLNRDKSTCSEVTKTFNDAWDYQWTIWSRNNGVWADPNQPLVRLSDFNKLQSLMNQGHYSQQVRLNFGLMGGVNITKHLRLEANYVLINLNSISCDSRHLSSFGLRYRWLLD